MTSIDPRSLDFATLNTLCLVHLKRSFSDAADELETNQSTVSYTIDRLRKAFGDPLFVRQGGRIVPTARCEDLVVEARLILEQFDGMVRSEDFDPSTTKTTLRISSNYYERIVILPLLIREMRKRAPGIQIQLIAAQDQGVGQLQRGETDVLLSTASISLNGIYAKQLILDRYVCLMDRDNPLASGEFTEEMFRTANHAFVTFAELWRSSYGVDMRRKGLDVTRVLSVATPDSLDLIMAETDLIAAIPSRIADIATDQMIYRDCPFPAPLQSSMYWTTRTQRSKIFVWLRDLIVQVSKKTTQTRSDI